MANLENLRKLRDQLDRLPDEKFYMGEFEIHIIEDARYCSDQCVAQVKACGTVACIAGWAKLLNTTDSEVHAEDFATKWLGLTKPEADYLFYGLWRRLDQDLDDIPRTDAIAEIDRMIAAEVAAPQPGAAP